jgi:hypothetical protein
MHSKTEPQLIHIAHLPVACEREKKTGWVHTATSL